MACQVAGSSCAPHETPKSSIVDKEKHGKLHFQVRAARPANLFNLGRVFPEYPESKVEDFYRLGRVLGRGGSGTTYLVHEIARGGAQFACKTIPKIGLRSRVAVASVRHEVRVLMHLVGSLNIVTLRDVFEDAKSVHIITNLCGGGELFDRMIDRGPFTEARAARLAYSIVECVQTCHSMGVAHRDLKPENFVFVDPGDDSKLVLIDFGLATFFESGDTFESAMGTMHYVAPEMLVGKVHGPEVDIWSAGVIVCLLLTGVWPFEGGSDDKEVIEFSCELRRQKLDLECEEWQRISDPAKALVRGMLAKDPKLRLTAHEILHHPWIQQHANESSVENAALA